jgi:hypothetical protein
MSDAGRNAVTPEGSRKMHRFMLALLVLVIPAPALANQPSAPQTMMAIMVMMPLAILFFTISGAARFYGKREKSRWRMSRLEAMVIWVIVIVLAAINEGGGVGWS